MINKPIVMITFTEGGENGGPYNSHKRIMESSLKEHYHFAPLIIPKGRIGAFNIKLIRKLRKDILKVKPDIVHFSGLQLQGFYVAVACKLARVKNTVLAIRGSSNDALYLAKWKKIIVNSLEKFTLRMTTVCYGVSEYVANWKIVKQNAKYCYGVIYNMPHDEYEADNDSSFRNEMGFNNENILITSVGRITREKGFEVLLEAIKSTRWQDNVKFLIAGNGSYFEEMKRDIMESDLTDKVYLLGRRQDIGRILSESDIFVICTLHETLCNAVIEAGQQSLATVATNVGGIPEIIRDGFNGCLVDVFDSTAVARSLEKLINDKDIRIEMGKNARVVINEKFDPSVMLSRVDDLYNEIMKHD